MPEIAPRGEFASIRMLSTGLILCADIVVNSLSAVKDISSGFLTRVVIRHTVGNEIMPCLSSLLTSLI